MPALFRAASGRGRALTICKGLLSGVVGLMRTRFDVPVRFAVVALLLVALLQPQWSIAADSPSTESDQSSWPAATSLLEQLDQLQGTSAEPWATATSQLLRSFESISLGQPLTPAELQIVRTRIAELRRRSQLATQVLGALQQQSARQQSARSADTAELVNSVYHIRYGLDRRIAVWDSLLDVVAKPQTSEPQSSFSLAKHGRIKFDLLDGQWREYLMLDDLKREFNSLNPDSDRQKNAARATLSRIYSPVLKPEQQDYLRQIFDPQLISTLRQSASQPCLLYTSPSPRDRG